tara:strand:+ start:410 stop:637 length:228 start_codon:yes stop_codon:yes gene_type:complete
MNKFIKTIRVFLLVILSLIIILTLYFILDRYIFNPRMKGISPVDIKNILTYLIAPLSVLLLIIWFIDKRKKILKK